MFLPQTYSLNLYHIKQWLLSSSYNDNRMKWVRTLGDAERKSKKERKD